MNDLRQAPRLTTYKAARIGCNGRRAVINCEVRNLSATGACLRLDGTGTLPDTFNLVFDSGEPSRMCRLVWRTATEIGVAFS